MVSVLPGLVQKAKLSAEALRFTISYSEKGLLLWVKEQETDRQPTTEWRQVGTFTNRRDVETFLVGLLCQEDR